MMYLDALDIANAIVRLQGNTKVRDAIGGARFAKLTEAVHVLYEVKIQLPEAVVEVKP